MYQDDHSCFTDDQLYRFSRDGFLVLESPVISKEELQVLRGALMDLFENRAGWKEGAQFDLVGLNVDSNVEQSLPQLLEPASFAGRIRRLQYRKTALAIAQKYLGEEAKPSFEHAILKPALTGPETPWHQDEAYRIDPAFEYQQLSIWLAIDDVTSEGGCMCYVPGSHQGELLTHDFLGGDKRHHALECTEDFDRSRAVACPLQAGCAVIHGGLTLHYSGPNTTPKHRYAYVLGFELPPRPREKSSVQQYPWFAERVSANWLRRRAWLLRGGIVTFLYRKIRYGAHLGPRHLLLQLRRAVRYMANFRRRSIKKNSNTQGDANYE